MVLQSILVLLLLFIFLVGWIAPLVFGLIRKKKGSSSLGLLIFAGCWGSLAVALGVFIGIGICTALRYARDYKAEEFVPEEYQGPVASIEMSYQGKSTLLALNETEAKNYNFTSSNGVFTVPAAAYKLTSYSINKSDENDKSWCISCYFYDPASEKRFELKEGEVSRMQMGPPLTVSVTKGELKEGKQRLDVVVKDIAGNKVSLRTEKPPVIEIIDSQGTVLWENPMEYG